MTQDRASLLHHFERVVRVRRWSHGGTCIFIGSRLVITRGALWYRQPPRLKRIVGKRRKTAADWIKEQEGRGV